MLVIILTSYFKIQITKLFRVRLWDYFAKKFLNSTWDRQNYQNIAKLVSRDIAILIEFIPVVYKFVLSPVILLIIVVYLLQSNNLWVILCLLPCLLFVPFSIFIARKSIKLAHEIYSYSEQRISNSMRYVKFRDYFLNWGNWQIFKKVKNAARFEVVSYNKDSFWRSLDLYSVLFGASLPVIILLILKDYFTPIHNLSLVMVLWVSPILISLIMEYGRIFSDLIVANRALESCNSYFINSVNSDIKDHVILDDKWDIWNGSLASNTLFNVEHQVDLIKYFNLDNEFGISIKSYDAVDLDLFGENISRGQKARILIIRGIYLSMLANKPLFINSSLITSLDPVNCELLYKIQDMYGIKFSDTVEEFVVNQITRVSSYESQGSEIIINSNSSQKINSIFQDNKNDSTLNKTPYRILFSYLGLLFLIPAYLLNFNTYVVESTFRVSQKNVILLWIIILGISISVIMGYFIELRLRKFAVRKHLLSLVKSIVKESENIKQIISKDYTVVIGRIAWYIHDINWYWSLIIVAIILVGINIKIYGVIIDLILISSLLMVYIFYKPKLIGARDNFVNEINLGTKLLSNLTSIPADEFGTIRKLKFSWVKTAFQHLQQGDINLFLQKSRFSVVNSTLIGFIIIIIITFTEILSIPKNITLFVITSIITVETIIVRNFQAIMGLSSQLNSFSRVFNTPFLPPSYIVRIDETATQLIISKCEHQFISQKYNSCLLNKGNLYSIVGVSGSGKTAYLRTISNFYGSKLGSFRHVHIHYLDNNINEISRELGCTNILELIEQINFNDTKVVILDEALSEFTIIEIQEFLGKLRKRFSDIIVLFVDHRFELENKINIEKLIEN